jgi:RNA polymerase II C-terminal domain phosphatase-like 3/4
MGNKLYATEMAKVLDPKGVLFAGRVISRGDDAETADTKSKDLEGVLGMESSVVIIDDSVRVWPHNKLNLIVVERSVRHSMQFSYKQFFSLYCYYFLVDAFSLY